MGDKNVDKFLSKMIEILDTEQLVQMDTELSAIEEWDSLSIISFLSMVDIEYGKKLVLSDIKLAKTIQDLFRLINEGK
jgi:acyl carrier protein